MRNELQRQDQLKELLQIYYKDFPNTKIYCKNEFFRTDGNALNRPDLIITNCPTPNLKFKHGKNISTPIGIELKDTTKTNDITSAMPQALKYLDYKYLIRKTKEELQLNTITFTTSNAIKTGNICKEFKDNKIIERIYWKFGIPILIIHNNTLVWSFRNKYFKLDGKLYGGFGKNATFNKY